MENTSLVINVSGTAASAFDDPGVKHSATNGGLEHGPRKTNLQSLPILASVFIVIGAQEQFGFLLGIGMTMTPTDARDCGRHVTSEWPPHVIMNLPSVQR